MDPVWIVLGLLICTLAPALGIIAWNFKPLWKAPALRVYAWVFVGLFAVAGLVSTWMFFDGGGFG